MATLMPMCAGLVGPKSENVEISLVLPLLFEGSRGPRLRQSREEVSEPRGLGGGRGGVNPPPRRLVWRFWEVRVCCSVATSTRFEAQGLGGLVIDARRAGGTASPPRG